VLFYILYFCLTLAGAHIIATIPWGDGDYMIFCFLLFSFLLLSSVFARIRMRPHLAITVAIWLVSACAGLYLIAQYFFIVLFGQESYSILLYALITSCVTMAALYELIGVIHRQMTLKKARISAPVRN
jgi:uncharacterized membrane protein